MPLAHLDRCATLHRVSSVEVRYRGRRDELRARGRRRDTVVAFRWGFDHEGAEVEQLSFVPVDEHMLLAQPVLYVGERRGWWYCDLITVTDVGHTVVIEDLYVDVLVAPGGEAYEVVDLDELATAVRDGDIGVDAALTGLEHVQTFLSRRLGSNKLFPPADVDPSAWPALPDDWRWSDREAP